MMQVQSSVLLRVQVSNLHRQFSPMLSTLYMKLLSPSLLFTDVRNSIYNSFPDHIVRLRPRCDGTHLVFAC